MFKTNDVIVCVKDMVDGLTLGERYTVLPNDSRSKVVFVIDDYGVYNNYHPDRFVLYKEYPTMMVWTEAEKDAEELQVIADLRGHSEYKGNTPVKTLSRNGTCLLGSTDCKTIEQWKEDTGFLFENTLHERFFKGNAVYWVIKKENIINGNNIEGIAIYKENDDTSEIMTKKSAEKYVKEHEAKYRPFTMEEFDEVGIKLIHKEYDRRDTVACYGSKVVTLHGIDKKLSYDDLLRTYTLIDGSPCGVKK